MFRELRKKPGFTLIEVIVATLVFALAVAGVMATVSSLSRPAGEASREVTAAFLGKQILDELRLDVAANSWDTGPLAAGNYSLAPILINSGISAITYNRCYTVNQLADGTRKVVLNITWEE